MPRRFRSQSTSVLRASAEFAEALEDMSEGDARSCWGSSGRMPARHSWPSTSPGAAGSAPRLMRWRLVGGRMARR